MIKTAVEQMQLCQIHFYQKIARKKVARVNVTLRLISTDNSEAVASHCSCLAVANYQ